MSRVDCVVDDNIDNWNQRKYPGHRQDMKGQEVTHMDHTWSVIDMYSVWFNK